jgi:putative Mn2+ efflux pump MntP
LGRKAGKVLGKRAELIGGLVLIAIGLRILLSHIL